MFTPLTTIAALQTSAVVSVDGDTRIILGKNRFRCPNCSLTRCTDTSPLDLTSGPRAEWPQPTTKPA